MSDTRQSAERGVDAGALHVIVAVFDRFGPGIAAIVDVPAARLDVVGLELALVVADRAGDAEIVAQLLGEVERTLRRDLARIVVPAALGAERVAVLLRIEGAGGLDLDRGADEVAVHIGVKDFFTSTDSMVSDETTSSATERASDSGAGMRTPLIEVPLRSGSRPRTET